MPAVSAPRSSGGNPGRRARPRRAARCGSPAPPGPRSSRAAPGPRRRARRPRDRSARGRRAAAWCTIGTRYALRSPCCRNQSARGSARPRRRPRRHGWRCVATQPGSPSSSPMLRRGYVAPSRSSESARASSVPASRRPPRAPTAGASISCAAARATRGHLVQIERRAMRPDSRAIPEPASRQSAAAFSRRSRSSRPPASPASRRHPLRRPAPCIRSAGTGTRPPRPPRARTPGSSGSAGVHEAAARGGAQPPA